MTLQDFILPRMAGKGKGKRKEDEEKEDDEENDEDKKKEKGELKVIRWDLEYQRLVIKKLIKSVINYLLFKYLQFISGLQIKDVIVVEVKVMLYA